MSQKNKNLDLRKWLQKNDLFDKDIFQQLKSQGIQYPEQDFVNFQQKDWDTATTEWRKDPKRTKKFKARVVKLEKKWREISKIKKSMGTKTTKKQGGNKKKKPTAPIEIARDLVLWLRKNECEVEELALELIDRKILSPKDIEDKITSQKIEDAICREATTRRNKNTQDQKQRNQLKLKLNTFRKALKSVTAYDRSMKTKKTNTKREESKENEQEGREIKEYLRGTEVGAIKDIITALLLQGVTKKEDLNSVDIKKWEEIHRIATNERNRTTQDSGQRQKLQNKLNVLKKLLISDFGFSTTMQTDKTQTQHKKTSKSVEQSPLVKELKKRTLWLKALEDEFNRREIRTMKDFENLSNDEFFKIYQQVKLEECANENETKKKGIEGKLGQLETMWRKLSGNEKKIGFKKN